MKGNSVFKGSLGFLSLPDILQIIAGSNSTGKLSIRSPYALSSGLIFFIDGSPIDAVNGQLRGMQAVYSLFGWTEAEFEFYPGTIQRKRTINCSPMQLTLDALRMLDDGAIEKTGRQEEVSYMNNGSCQPVILKGPLVDYGYIVNEEKFRCGTEFVREGAHGNWIWVILEGTAEVSKETLKGPMTIARIGEGCFIGTLLSLMHGQNSRSATVTALSDISLGVLDTQRLAGEFRRLSPDFRSVLISLDGRLRKISERTARLFSNDPAADEKVVGEELVIEESLSSGDLFMIREGETYIVSSTSEGQLPLIRLEKRDVIGHSPFITIDQDQSTQLVLASKHLKVDRLDTEVLEFEYNQLSNTFRNLIRNVGDCVSATKRLACSL